MILVRIQEAIQLKDGNIFYCMFLYDLLRVLKKANSTYFLPPLAFIHYVFLLTVHLKVPRFICRNPHFVGTYKDAGFL